MGRPWSYRLSRKAAEAHSFEPNPDVEKVLRRTVASNVTVHRIAASDVSGLRDARHYPRARGTEDAVSLEGLEESTRAVDVETCRIDDLKFEGVNFMKIDVEGHERAVIAGATNLIQTEHPLLVADLEERHGGIAPAVDLLAEWGYSAKVRVEGRWVGLDDFDLAADQAEHLDRYAPQSSRAQSAGRASTSTT